jgi:hypothetical protein
LNDCFARIRLAARTEYPIEAAQFFPERRKFMFRFLVFATFLLFASPVFAQEPVSIPTKSKNFQIRVTLETPPNWDGNRRDDPGFPGNVAIYRKGEKEPFQKISLPVLATNNAGSDVSPTSDYKKRVEDYLLYSFSFEDFNFDGREDLSICTGHDGGYNSPSYDVFLFDPKTRGFIRNEEFSELTVTANIGLKINSRTKTIRAQSKSGCCFHQTDVFRVVKNRLVLVKSTTEQYESETRVTISTRKKVGARWVETTRTKTLPPPK